jgi:NADPH-dependent F420 reductase
MKIAVFGGTGKFGSGLATRISATPHDLVIAARDEQKAAMAAQGFGQHVRGMSHSNAAAWCELGVIATPYAGHSALLEVIKPGMAGKIVIDAAVPLDPKNPTRTRTESGSSAAEEAAATLVSSKIFAAFHTVSHHVLQQPRLSCDVLVAGGEDGKSAAFDFIRSLNLRPIHAGGLGVAHLLECATALLIAVNKTNKVRESGIQITGL